jgi:hypothetical protein
MPEEGVVGDAGVDESRVDERARIIGGGSLAPNVGDAG